jgi:anti-sigma regulatory factor (Ser/Thr protein kinase)/anti-anti-sigma regulatory factor
MDNSKVSRNGNSISVIGPLLDFRRFLSEVHKSIINAGYTDIVFDFSKCTSAFQSSMLAICAQTMRYTNEGILFELKMPEVSTLSNLFKNTNWAHLIDSKNYMPSVFRGHTRIPATQYKNANEQQKAVNKIANTILGAIPDLKREDFAAFEWAINEITDNVLVHSNSPIGGLVQISTFQRKRKQVEFVVADAGLSIPQTLRDGRPEILSDTDALDKAIREGVTRDKSVGQGNGLFGSYQVCSESRGKFEINSSHGKLFYDESRGLHIANEVIPYSGTLVSATIDFSVPHLLENALKFDGKKYKPNDYVENHYETGGEGEICINLLNEAESFGSRVAGTPIRIKIKNMIRIEDVNQIIIDLDGISLISSSFADEVFAKLFLEIGPMEFMKKIKITNSMATVKSLIDKAITQRMSTGM